MGRLDHGDIASGGSGCLQGHVEGLSTTFHRWESPHSAGITSYQDSPHVSKAAEDTEMAVVETRQTVVEAGTAV